VLDVGEVKEVLPELILSQLVRRAVEVCGELSDGPDVGLLGAHGESSELHVFEHALAECCHGVPFLGGCHRPEKGTT
jgi:hypothetical protein